MLNEGRKHIISSSNKCKIYKTALPITSLFYHQ